MIATTAIHAEPITGTTLFRVLNLIAAYVKGIPEENVLGITFNQDDVCVWSAMVFVVVPDTGHRRDVE